MPDNLASNSDVVSGAQRGTNGLSAANLRGQGNAATLVLLNGRRVAAHGLSGSAVDVNQIPFAAIERIEVLKDGASAIYGTDAVGGVINFITKKNLPGAGCNGFSDITEAGGGNIYRLSGDRRLWRSGRTGLQRHGLRSPIAGTARCAARSADFVNGNQPNRGLSIDTRGTPIATVFNIGANASDADAERCLPGRPLASAKPAPTAAAAGGHQHPRSSRRCGLRLDGRRHGLRSKCCGTRLTQHYACAWDTGRAAALQQPLETLTYYGRATLQACGEHELFAEVTGSDADSAKKLFATTSILPTTPTLPIAYPLNALTAATYNAGVQRDRRGAFRPMRRPHSTRAMADRSPVRWRCIACGTARIRNQHHDVPRRSSGSKDRSAKAGITALGGSYASSDSSSVLGTGYHFRGVFTSAAARRLGVPGAIPAGPIRARRLRRALPLRALSA